MELDTVDKAILYLLQRENRTELTTSDIADEVDVSTSTVSNRIHNLREDGVLRSSIPDIDYERAGFPHHVLFVCTTPISGRKEIAREALDILTVVTVRELLTGDKNLHVEAVCADNGDVETTAEELEALDLAIDQTEMMRHEHRQPIDYFGDALDNS